MLDFAQWGQWWNLIFIVPFGIGAAMVLLTVLGAGRHGTGHGAGHGAGHGLGHGAGHGVGHGIGQGASHMSHGTGHGATHVGHGHAATTGHVAHHAAAGHSATQSHGLAGHSHAGHNHSQHDARQHAQTERDGARGLATMLHLDNIPPLMLMQNFLLFWGIVGWAVNLMAGRGPQPPGNSIVTSLLAALFGGLVLTLALSAVLARFTPGEESYAITRGGLIGRAGEAVSAVTETSGSVYVRDEQGTLHHIAGRVEAGHQSVVKGTQVLIVDYAADRDVYQVREWTPETYLAAQETASATPEHAAERPTEAAHQ